MIMWKKRQFINRTQPRNKNFHAGQTEMCGVDSKLPIAFLNDTRYWAGTKPITENCIASDVYWQNMRQIWPGVSPQGNGKTIRTTLLGPTTNPIVETATQIQSAALIHRLTRNLMLVFIWPHIKQFVCCIAVPTPIQYLNANWVNVRDFHLVWGHAWGINLSKFVTTGV